MMSDHDGGADTPMNADDELQMMTPMISDATSQRRYAKWLHAQRNTFW
jgi:hypothetical protein